MRHASIRYRFALALLAAIVMPLPAPAQEAGSIAGTVRPTHGHDFVLATVRIPDLARQVAVGADGSFRFDTVRPGSYLLEVRVPSLGTVAKRVDVVSGEAANVEFVLTPGSHSEEIVVTASADARDPNELTTPATSLSGQELALRLEASLGETLAQEPGISSTFFGPGASRPIIRGLTGDRVRTLEGGIGTGDAAGVSADHAVTIDPGQAERIEVVRGPGTLLYGSSAIGGVVNVIDERIPTVRATQPVNGQLSFTGGTVSDERYGGLTLGGGTGDWAWHASTTVRDTSDYAVRSLSGSDGEDFVPNSDLASEGGRLGATYFFGDRGYLGVSTSIFETEYGLPGDARPDAGELTDEGPVRIDMKQRRYDLRSQIRRPFPGFEALKVRVGATDYEHAELEGDEIGSRFFNDTVEARLELVQSPRGRSSGSLGLQFFERDLEAIGAEAFLPQTDTGRWALFTLQEIDAGPLRWQLGARFERQSLDPADQAARDHKGLSASLGMIWQASETVSVATSVARSTKLPAPEELFSNGLHVATQAFEVGDPLLGEETGLGLDVSLRMKRHRFSGELTLFRQSFDDFIFQAFTGEQAEGFPIVRYRQRDATFSGAELKARVELFERATHHVHLSFVGDTVRAKLDVGGNLPRIPPMRLGGGVHYHSERWNASAEVRWIDRQRDIAVSETVTPGHTLINASLGYRFLFRRQIFDLLLRGRNLGDADARSHTSFLKEIAPLPGRDVSMTLKLRF